MPDTILFYGLPGDGLDTFLRKYREAAAEDPFAAWLILPTKRLVTKTVRGLAESPGTTVLSSRICTLQEFCTEYFLANRTTTRLLGRAESRLLLQQILIANKKDLPLFFTRGNPSSATLESLQEFMQVVIRRKIAYPSCLGDLQSEKSRQMGMVLAAYKKMLEDRELVDPDTVFSWTLRPSGHPIMSGQRPCSYTGSIQPLPLEAELLSLLRNEAREFVVFLPSGSDEKVFCGGDEWIGTPRRTEEVPVLDPGKTGVTGLFSETPGTLAGSGIRCANLCNTITGDLPGGRRDPPASRPRGTVLRYRGRFPGCAGEPGTRAGRLFRFFHPMEQRNRDAAEPSSLHPGIPRRSRGSVAGVLPRCSPSRCAGPALPVRPFGCRRVQGSRPRSAGARSGVEVCPGREMGIRLGAGIYVPGKAAF